ncbi:hypothetical protein AAGS61_02155 [Lysinibacillus sp. KU-BSD001]|uniref:hypothetical protein n=1 Tax=Lysinibacillus sp. KU-BSD001 TaxID=3141328 RepID=UPI0036E64FCC
MAFETKLTEEQIHLAQQHVKDLKTRSHLSQDEKWLISMIENAMANDWVGIRKETEEPKINSKEDAVKRLKALKERKV